MYLFINIIDMFYIHCISINIINMFYISEFCNMYMVDLILRLQQSRARTLSIIITKEIKIHVCNEIIWRYKMYKTLLVSVIWSVFPLPTSDWNRLFQQIYSYKSPCLNIKVCCFLYRLLILKPVRRSVFGRSIEVDIMILFIVC